MLDFIRCPLRSGLMVTAGLAALALAGCGTSYQCDIYSLDDGSRLDTVWYDAESAGEAEDMCEGEYAPGDCECYEDN